MCPQASIDAQALQGYVGCLFAMQNECGLDGEGRYGEIGNQWRGW